MLKRFILYKLQIIEGDIINKKIYAILISLMFIILIFSTSITYGKIELKKRINVAIIMQNWDILDNSFSTKLSVFLHKRCLKQYENKYNVKFRIYEFWDSFEGGDVQNGLLKKLRIDVVIGPGGFGCLCTPEKYRAEIKDFIRLGGGFYGICGDSTFGSLGVTHTSRKFLRIVNRIFEIESITPMLKLANVYTDASVFEPIIEENYIFTKIDIIRSLVKLPMSRAAIYFKKTNPPIQEPYFRRTVRTMMGNAPLIDGPRIYRIFMPRIITIAFYLGCDEPYDKSIRGKKAIIGTTYGIGRVVLSSPHPEFTLGNLKAHEIYIRNVLWLANALPNS